VTIALYQFTENNDLRIYRDWQSAWWRENIQNSVDAGSSRIDISIIPTDDESSMCIVSDNGCGMSRETLEDTYFVLGETTKGSANDIGGFGKARILTCFAQNGYNLTTGNLYVWGCGATYEIEEVTTLNKHSHSGVHLAVDVISNADVMRRKLVDYLTMCQLPCDVYIDGDKWQNWTGRNRFARDLSFGKLYTNKSADPRLLVRVNGTLMYSRYTSAPAQVVLEIQQDISRNVLQATRDGMNSEFQEELDAFLVELAIDKRSALRPKKNKSTAYKGTGTFRSRRKSKNTDIDDIAKWSTSGQGLGFTDGVPPLPTDNYRYGGLNLFDVIIEDDTDNPAVRKVIEQYDPNNWDLDKDSVRSNINGEYRRGIRRLKLLLVWKAACDKVIEILQDTHYDAPSDISWCVGWLFSDTGIGANKIDGGISYLLLNPCDKDGRMRFSLSDKADLCKIISTAVHEVTHILHEYHDESFANLQSQLVDVVLNRKQEILNHMESVKETAFLFADKA
jgi:hypothetical protein